MSYVVEVITEQVVDKIMEDACCDNRKHTLLSIRGGDFQNKADAGYVWSVDHDKNYYLYFTRKADIRSLDPEYFFFYKKSLYRIILVDQFERTLKIEAELSSDTLLVEVQTEVLKAFSHYPYLGLKDSGVFKGLHFQKECK
ncbi:hypothetical protein [Psychromonas ossibalaenae]|uniref:hypothetical protein n=1 Tax=Psychromonas ossibalaenae TaxID=444922 RepID=UPI0003AAE472|nr:hypothetical protein [Psychromonas ossibalaenae]